MEMVLKYSPPLFRSKQMKEEIKKILIRFQKYELTEHIIYSRLSARANSANSKILKKISEDELKHYNILKGYSKMDIKPDKWMILRYLLLSRILGITFAIKLMEKGEEKAKFKYKTLFEDVPETKSIVYDEEEHERILIKTIDEDLVKHIGSMVLGLNDALVELTGALVGFTFALKDVTQIGMAGLITGIAASLSMASSEYLSTKTEKGKNPFKSSLYTGSAYLFVVLLLVTPYFLFSDYKTAFIITITNVFLIIFFFNIFVSVVREVSFKRSFLEMFLICTGVSVISFIAGIVLRSWLGVH